MHLSDDDKISFMEREETMNLSEILPEPHSDWELHTDGDYYKIIENTKFCRLSLHAKKTPQMMISTQKLDYTQKFHSQIQRV